MCAVGLRMALRRDRPQLIVAELAARDLTLVRLFERLRCEKSTRWIPVIVDLGKLPKSDERTGYPTPIVLFHNRDLFDMPTPPAPRTRSRADGCIGAEFRPW